MTVAAELHTPFRAAVVAVDAELLLATADDAAVARLVLNRWTSWLLPPGAAVPWVSRWAARDPSVAAFLVEARADGLDLSLSVNAGEGFDFLAAHRRPALLEGVLQQAPGVLPPGRFLSRRPSRRAWEYRTLLDRRWLKAVASPAHLRDMLLLGSARRLPAERAAAVSGVVRDLRWLLQASAGAGFTRVWDLTGLPAYLIASGGGPVMTVDRAVTYRAAGIPAREAAALEVSGDAPPRAVLRALAALRGAA